jgi:hypothetical protein
MPDRLGILIKHPGTVKTDLNHSSPALRDFHLPLKTAKSNTVRHQNRQFDRLTKLQIPEIKIDRFGQRPQQTNGSR